MGYIIVWRNSHREPHVQVDSHDFKDEYYDYETAKSAAEEILKAENQSSQSPWYFDYAIYEEANG